MFCMKTLKAAVSFILLLDCGDVERSEGTANYTMDRNFGKTAKLAAALRS